MMRRGALALALVALPSCALFVSFDDRPHAPRALRGTVSGIASGTVSLQLEDERRDAVNGPFAFSAILAYESTYHLTIASPPQGHHCSIRGGEGAVGDHDIEGVEVRCAPELVDCDAGGGSDPPPACP